MHNPSIIREKLKPSLELDELSFSEDLLTYSEYEPKKSETYLGTSFPVVKIRSTILHKEQIIHLSIDYTDFLPKIVLTFTPDNIGFLAYDFPFDGEIVSIFVRSWTEAMKPIRNDFEILNLEYHAADSDEIGATLVTLTGRLRIPNLYDDKTESTEDTSWNTLLKVCDSFGLGYASNIESTDDKMRWINNTNTETYIKWVAEHSWIGENSFMHCFVDPYYVLNFIDMNKQFSFSNENNPGVFSATYIRDHFENRISDIEVDDFFITNMPDMQLTNNYISNYKLINNSTAITNRKGVGQDFNFYDFTTKQAVRTLLEPLITEGGEDATLLRGRVDETYVESLIKNRWAGVQYSYPIGNTHKNYLVAKYFNTRNKEELEKMNLEVDLPSFNPSIYVGQRLRVYIFSSSNTRDAEILKGDNTPVIYTGKTPKPYVLNKLLSGFFVVKGYKITYSYPDYQARQTVTLVRREWNTQFSDVIL